MKIDRLIDSKLNEKNMRRLSVVFNSVGKVDLFKLVVSYLSGVKVDKSKKDINAFSEYLSSVRDDDIEFGIYLAFVFMRLNSFSIIDDNLLDLMKKSKNVDDLRELSLKICTTLGRADWNVLAQSRDLNKILIKAKIIEHRKIRKVR